MQKVDVYLTADIEFDVNGAFTFPDRYQPIGAASVFRQDNGQSEGIARLLAPLIEHDLPATHFIETLQSYHFGTDDMAEVVDTIRQQRQADIQLHLHPAWAYCKPSDWRKTITTQRKNDSLLDREDDVDSLIHDGITFFEKIVGNRPVAVRTGSLLIDRGTLRRFAASGIGVSSSVGMGINMPRDRELQLHNGLARIDGMLELPITSLRSLGLRRIGWRLLTVTGTPLAVMKRVLDTASRNASGPVVFLTHAHEFSHHPAAAVAPKYRAQSAIRKRWDALCRYLASNPDRFNMRSVGDLAQDTAPTLYDPSRPLADAGMFLFAHRLCERVFGP